MNGWIDITLGELCDLGGGTIRTGPFGSQLHQSDYSDVGAPVVMPQDLIDSRVSEASIARVGPEHVRRLSQHQLQVGDIVYGRRGDIGRRALITEREAGWLCGTGCLRIAPGTGHVNSRFLFYALGEPATVEQIAKKAVGATMLNLNTTILREVPLRLPPLLDQDRIVSILGAYDDLIEVNRQRTALLEQMARRLFEEWFVRFRFPGNGNGADATRDWQSTTIEAVCNVIQAGSTPSRANEEFWANGTIDWYSTGELQDSFLLKSKEQVGAAALRAKKARLFDEGTILMAIYGSPTVGRLGIATKSCSCNQAALAMRPNTKKIGQWFLFHTLQSLRAHFNSLAQGAAQQNISKEKVCATQILLPPRDLLERFEVAVAALWELRRNLAQQQSALGSSRDLLLPRLISGELAVSRAKRELEAVA